MAQLVPSLNVSSVVTMVVFWVIAMGYLMGRQRSESKVAAGQGSAPLEKWDWGFFVTWRWWIGLLLLVVGLVAADLVFEWLWPGE